MFLWGVFDLRGHFVGLSFTCREGWHCGDLKVDILGTDLGSLAAAGVISGGEEVSLRAAMLCRCSINRVMGGRQASMAKNGDWGGGEAVGDPSRDLSLEGVGLFLHFQEGGEEV